MDTQTIQDDEIDLISLFFYVLARWKSILVVTLAVALLGCGYAQLSHSEGSTYTLTDVYYVSPNYAKVVEMDGEDAMYIQDNGNTFSLYYQKYASDLAIYQQISPELGMPAQALRGMVKIEEVDNNAFSISASHEDAETARRLLAALGGQLMQLHEKWNAQLTEHQLTLVMETSDVTEGKAAATAKWSGIGALVGFVIMVGIYCVKALMSGQVYALSDLASQCQLPILGSMMADGRKLDAVARGIRRAQRRLTENTPENERFLAQNIRNHAGNARNILVCSDISTRENERLVHAVEGKLPELHFTVGGNLLADADTLQALPQCDAVLLTVTLEKSHISDVRQALALIQNSQKPVVGWIAIE